MSVYTSIDDAELKAFLGEYAVGELKHYEGIQSGIENTNYFVSTTKSEYVLTIFEHHTRNELQFFLDLTAFLAEHEIPSAHPVQNNQADYLGELKNKPAALVDRLPGASVEHPGPAHCIAVGDVLARLHLAGQQFSQQRENNRGPHWWQTTVEALAGHIDDRDAALLQEELRFQKTLRGIDLPRGIVHADLFRDNVLFLGDRLCGLIDFYYACTDVLLFDVAVTVNDWCSHENGALDVMLARELLAAYAAVRPVSSAERNAWPAMLRAAALRFWLSRLHDLHFPRPGEITHTKDPDAFKRILIHHLNHGADAIALWPQPQKRGLA